MNHFVNTVILLLFYRYIGLWYKKRPRPLGCAPSPSGQDVRFCARPFFLQPRFFSEVTSFKRGHTSEFRPSALTVIPSGQDRKWKTHTGRCEWS